MDKTYLAEIQRLFLIEALPEPLTRASSHLQIFDNYIPNTRMRLRAVRQPETREWSHFLQQRMPENPGDLACMKVAQIRLNEAEHEQFQVFEGAEIRKNRYFHEFNSRVFAFDVYLGALWGLNVAKIEFGTVQDSANFEPPLFALFEVTGDDCFDGASLVGKTIEDLREAVAKLKPLVKSIEDRNEE